MKRIFLTALLALNTSIASAAIQFYTFTGAVSSSEVASVSVGTATSYTFAIDFSGSAVSFSNGYAPVYETDNDYSDYSYASFYSGSNHSTPLGGGFYDPLSPGYVTDTNILQQLLNSTTVNIYSGSSNDSLRLYTNSPSSFAIGAAWTGSELSLHSAGRSTVYSALTLTSISSVSPVPEPSTLFMFGAGLAFLGFRRKKVTAA